MTNDMDKRTAAEQSINRHLLPIVKALSLHHDDLEFNIYRREVGVIPGLVIEMRPNKADAPRIYGKHRQNYNALSVLAESIGHTHKVPVKLGYMHEAVKNTPEEGRRLRDRTGAMEPIVQMLTDISGVIFQGETPRIEVVESGSGALRFIIHISPAGQRILQTKYEALQTLFKAICAPFSWLPTIEIVQDLERYEPQPKTSDGRFARERQN